MVDNGGAGSLVGQAGASELHLGLGSLEGQVNHGQGQKCLMHRVGGITQMLRQERGLLVMPGQVEPERTGRRQFGGLATDRQTVVVVLRPLRCGGYRTVELFQECHRCAVIQVKRVGVLSQRGQANVTKLLGKFSKRIQVLFAGVDRFVFSSQVKAFGF